MDGTIVKKRYYVSKQFYRYIRPGAQMLDAITTDAGVLSTAFINTRNNAFTSVLINSSATDKVVTLAGNNIPATYQCYITTSAADKNCTDIGTVNNGEIVLPANSIVTLTAQANLGLPTPGPTPTLGPTAPPTPTPTLAPTAKPTAPPTPTPTLAPTAPPTPTATPNFAAPSINTITNSATSISGKAVNGGVVLVNMGSGKGYANVVLGVWKLKLSNPLKAGTKVSATVLLNGQTKTSAPKYVIPATPSIKTLKANNTVVKGNATKGSTVYVKIGSKKYSVKASLSTGAYSCKVLKLKKGETVTVYCKSGGQTSASKIIKVYINRIY